MKNNNVQTQKAKSAAGKARATTAKSKSTAAKSEKQRGFFGILRDTFLLIINLVVVALLLVAAKSSLINPEDLWFAVYPNYMLPFLAVLNLIFFIYWLIRWRYRALISLAVFIITFNNCKVWMPINVSQESPSLTEKEVKLLTYNTMQFSGMKAHTKETPNEVLKYLSASQADIICLQETMCHSSSKYLRKEDVLKAMKDYPHQFSLPGKSSMNMWVFSKYPILKCKRIEFESVANASFYCDIQIGGKIIRVINNHLESNKLTAKDKSLYKDIIDEPNKESITHVARALSDKLAPAAVMRAQQAEKVAEEIARSPYPVIVCGDFNDIPNSYTYRTVSKGLKDAWVQNASGLGITFHEKFYLFRIDYIFHSPSIKTYRTKIDRVPHSDHYPLWTYFQVL